jgi:cyclophilin family peptidyl-prolyl cis-trans isomerase
MIPLVGASCVRESAYSKMMTQDYPELYTFVFERNADSLLTFTDHANNEIRQQAWRALASTPIDDMDAFITKVQYDNSEVAWMALSMHELTEKQLDRLHDLWNRRPAARKGVSLVLGRQGNQESLDLLVRNFKSIIDSDYEFESALAMGRLMENYELSDANQRVILRYAAVIKEVELFRAYFYGLYRGEKSLKNEDLESTLWDTYSRSASPEIKEYALRILFNTDAQGFFNKMDINNIEKMNVQLAIELAKNLNKLPWTEKLEQTYAKLLEHTNPVVNEVALQQIFNHPKKNPAFDQVIIDRIVENEKKSSTVRLSGIIALNDRSPYMTLTDFLAEGNPYALAKKLRIYQEEMAPDAYLQTIEKYISGQNRMEKLFAAEGLLGWWKELSTAQQTSARKKIAKALVFQLLGNNDRSITYVTVPFMQSSGLMKADDYPKLKKALQAYKLPEDIEVYQIFGELFKEQFEAQANPLIDSLAQKGNAALNNFLVGIGWDIPDTPKPKTTFRTPNWERLTELGPAPIWVLETKKGRIKIEMDVLSAPATISGMDSLTQAGAYNEVAFHRVVPNFVVQGGDVESGDGFGSPDYIVPTEASEKQYKRGVVGIASAGTDTEGSQYFIMHEWAPHLNGRYTIIGKVIEGMEIVDKLVVGDKVVKALWQLEK